MMEEICFIGLVFSGGFFGNHCKALVKQAKKYYNRTMLHLMLVEPEIPQNAGNVARTCAATGCALHLVRPLGFELSDKYLKRAGLDYWPLVDVTVHENFEEAEAALCGLPFFFFTTKARKGYTEVSYPADCVLVFGKETAGLPEELLLKHREECVRIPMREGLRSLNLANCAAVAVYEALRQNAFEGLQGEGQLHRYRW